MRIVMPLTLSQVHTSAKAYFGAMEAFHRITVKTYVRVPRLIVVVAALLFSLPTNTVKAGIQSAIEAFWDRLEASNPDRDFVPPFAGTNTMRNCVGWECPVDPVRWSFAPTLVYDWNTGNLSAEIPAAVINAGRPDAPVYEKIYTINSLAIDSHLLPYATTHLNSTVLGWSEQNDGPLELVAADPTILRSNDLAFWIPSGLMLPGSWPPSARPAAAVIDFGAALPSGLTRSDFAALGFGDPESNYVNYFNHRGIVTLRVPLSLAIVPEPSNLIEAFIAALTIALYGRFWRVTVAP
jgi:hypothetical protein